MLCKAAQHLGQQLNSLHFGEHCGTHQADIHTFWVPDFQENRDAAALLVGHLLQGLSLIQTNVMGLKHTFSFTTSLVSLSHPGVESKTLREQFLMHLLCTSEVKQFLLFCLPTHSALGSQSQRW